MPTIVHFEIPSDNVERSRRFYNELFGWNIEQFSGSEKMPDGMEYWMITTTDDKGNKAVGGLISWSKLLTQRKLYVSQCLMEA